MDGTDIIWLNGVLDEYDFMLTTASTDNGNLVNEDVCDDPFVSQAHKTWQRYACLMKKTAPKMKSYAHWHNHPVLWGWNCYLITKNRRKKNIFEWANKTVNPAR